MKKISKKWRELSIKSKLKIPENYFDIDKNEINRIRKIKKPKDRLIESARIQHKLFSEIHSYLTAWIAGYSSDAVVRQYFGSSKYLREMFIKSPKMINGITSSWMDIKRGIKIPDQMSNELAEEIGIHIGDGSLHITIDKNGSKSYQYSISGDLKNEANYHERYISKLMKGLYNIDSRFSKRENKNSIETIYKSKAIGEYKANILKLPVGNKKDIKIPDEIMNNKEFQKRCVVGIIDTDFSVTKFLAINGKIHSLKVANQIHEILLSNNIQHIYRVYNDHARFYIPKDGTLKIVNEWKLNNQKHLTKFGVFKKFKKFIPFSTTQERLDLLGGRISLNYLENICKKRASEEARAQRFPLP